MFGQRLVVAIRTVNMDGVVAHLRLSLSYLTGSLHLVHIASARLNPDISSAITPTTWSGCNGSGAVGIFAKNARALSGMFNFLSF